MEIPVDGEPKHLDDVNVAEVEFEQLSKSFDEHFKK